MQFFFSIFSGLASGPNVVLSRTNVSNTVYCGIIFFQTGFRIIKSDSSLYGDSWGLREILSQAYRILDLRKRLDLTWIRERSRMVQMQGGNDVDYPGVISTSCQRSRCAVIGRPEGRRGEDQQIRFLGDNVINPRYCIEYYLKPSRIQV